MDGVPVFIVICVMGVLCRVFGHSSVYDFRFWQASGRELYSTGYSYTRSKDEKN